jgi:hypothetical protein
MKEKYFQLTEIKKSNALINAFYNISVDTYKIFSLAASKFKAFLDYALNLGADKISTGHYARITQENGCNSVYNVGVDGHTNFSDRQPDMTRKWL